MNLLGAGCLAELPPWTERGTVNGGRPALSQERLSMSPGDLPKADAVPPPVAEPADALGCPFRLAERGRTRVSDIRRRPKGWQGFPSQEDLVQHTPKTASVATEICFSLRIQTIRLERLPCISPGSSHSNALPSCIGSPPAAATVREPAKPAGIQVFVTAAPIGVCLIIIQFRQPPSNNPAPSSRAFSKSWNYLASCHLSS